MRFIHPVKVLVACSALMLISSAFAASQKPGDTIELAKQQIIALEKKRCAAIDQRDFVALADVLADDYVHVYGGGTSSDKAGYIAQVKEAPRTPTRGPLTVRVYGDLAVVTGDLLNRIQNPGQPERVLDTYVTQVAHKENGKWRFVSFQITQKPNQASPVTNAPAAGAAPINTDAKP